MEYLLKSDILFLNKRTIEAHGGNFIPPYNLLNESNLDYLLDAVSAEVFGQELYPTIEGKAAVYLHHIITSHIFQDGNKRTGLGACLLFLRLNGYRLTDNINHNSLINYILSIAEGKITFEEIKTWLSGNIVV